MNQALSMIPSALAGVSASAIHDQDPAASEPYSPARKLTLNELAQRSNRLATRRRRARMARQSRRANRVGAR